MNTQIARVLTFVTMLSIPSLIYAQSPPSQLTNDDLLKLIGLQQIQNFQCGKMLDTVQQRLQTIEAQMKKPEPPKDVK